MMKIKKIALSIGIALSITSPLMADFNDTQALQASLYFFNENALGPINDNVKIPASTGVPYQNPVVWKGDSFTHDGQTIVNGQLVTIPNLNTGFADAGDTIKYNLPQSYAMMMLAWSGVEYKQNYIASGQYTQLANVLRWGMQYLLNCWQPAGSNPTTSASSYLIVQTGIGAQAEHDLWVSDDVFEQAIQDNASTLPKIQLGGQAVNYQRLAYYVNIAHPGPDIGGAMAAAMAAGATFFANSPIHSDQVLAQQLYTASQQVLSFSQEMALGTHLSSPDTTANQNMGYSDIGNAWQGNLAQTDSTTTYNDTPGVPNHYAGKLALASLWLAQASQVMDGGAKYQTYLTQGEQILANAKLTAQDSSWTLDWGNFYYGAFLLLAKMDPTGTDPVSQSTPKFTYAQDVQSWLLQLQTNAAKNPDDFAYLAGWESLRYATDTSFVADLADTYLKTTQFQKLAYDQLDYVEGHNPAGYNYEIGVVGSGSQNALNAHNATAEDSWTQNQTLVTTTGVTLYAHQLIGALVGGPASANGTGYNPTVNDYGTNEPTLDGNASFAAALSAQYTGQAPFNPSVFPPQKPSTLPWPEFYGTVTLKPATIIWNGNEQQEIDLNEFNHSAWPARILYNQTATLYFNFSDMPAGKTINDIQVVNNYGPGYSTPTWTKLDDHGNYSLSFANTAITYPGGTWANGLAVPPDHRPAQIVLTLPWKHNFSQDWSFQGLTPDIYDAGQSYGQFAPNIAIYGSTTPTGAMQLLGGNPLDNHASQIELTFSNLPSNLPANTQDQITVDGSNFSNCTISSSKPCVLSPLNPGVHSISAADITLQNGNQTNVYHFVPQSITLQQKQDLPVTLPFPAPSVINNYTTSVSYHLNGLGNNADNPGATVHFADPSGAVQTCTIPAGQTSATCTVNNQEGTTQPTETFTVSAPSIPGYSLTTSNTRVSFSAGIANPNQLSATYLALPTYPVYVAATLGNTGSSTGQAVIDFKAASNGQVYADSVALDGAQHPFNLPKDNYTLSAANISVQGKTYSGSVTPSAIIINGNSTPQVAADYELLGTCVITYTKPTNFWATNGGTGATLNFNVTNNSTRTIPATWTLTINGTHLIGNSGVWNWQNVTVSNGSATGTAVASWETIAPGQTLSGIGMNLLLSSSGFTIQSASLNGMSCLVSPSP